MISTILPLIVSLLIISEFACDSGTDPSVETFFAVYRLQDSNVAASQIWNKPLGDLALAHEPFLTQRDMRSYHWHTHEFEVTPAGDSMLAFFKNQPGPVGGIPFVVTVGNDRIYLGAFWYPYSSLSPQVPYIDVVLTPHRLSAAWDTRHQTDPRNDARVYAALKAAGVLVE